MLTLRHIQNIDYPQIKKFVTSEKVCQFLTWKNYTEESKIEEYFQKVLTKTWYPDEVLWIILWDTLIWTIHIIERGLGKLQFWFWILPEYWWMWFWSESVKLALERLKTYPLAQYELWGDIHKNNIYGKNILNMCGFQFFQSNIEPNRNRYIQSFKKD